MVVVTCYLSCSVRRCPPSRDSTPYLQEMHTLMRRLCTRTGDGLLRTQDTSSQNHKPYQDKLINCCYDINSRYTSHAQARLVLVKAFSEELKRLVQSDKFFYIYVEAEPVNEELGCFYYDVPLQSFCLGFMPDPTTVHAQFNYQEELFPWTNEQPTATVELDKECIAVDFAVSQGARFMGKVAPGNISSTTEVYKLSINFKHLSPSVIVHVTDRTVDICFQTTTPVQLWRTQYQTTGMSRKHFDKTNWIRCCSVKSANTTGNMRAPNKETLGGCHVFILRFQEGSNVQSILQSLAYFSDFSIYYTYLNYKTKIMLNQPAPYVDGDTFQMDDVNWMLAAFHSLGYRVRHQLEDSALGGKFMETVHNNVRGGRDKRKHVYNALCKTYDVMFSDSDQFLQVDRVLQYFIGKAMELDEMVMTQARMVKRLIVTPSRVLFQPPCLMHDNRVLRMYHADSAVSCSFQNDDMTGFAAVANSVEFVDEVVGTVLRRGVFVAKRHYEFLGCSGSQLKNNGGWFYATDPEGITAKIIRDNMGDLENIRRPGTYLSRMGQCFSDTTAAELDWEIDIVWDDPDIEGGRDPEGKPYCFSDGVGRISEECLRLVFMRLTDERLPSAFQVRLGGSKGMLTMDRNLSGKKIMVRNSMFKFKCSNATVEVMRRTQPTPLYLNNQVITLLSQRRNGIPDHVFIRLLNVMLHRLADVLLDDNKAMVALSQSGFSCCYSKLHRAGFKFTRDPFFKEVLKAITCSRINNLKLKTRIEIPTDYGRAMLGVMDEEGVLEYGEVYVQYSSDLKTPKEKTVVLTGDVVVSKMPAMHPGDVRKFQAVDRPELNHLVDCIVFPQKGRRPHPNEMAGSDLDGDEYFVTWHPDLIFRGENETAMDFPSIRKPELNRPITLEDMVEFIVNYIVNDKVGVISNAHTALADTYNIYNKRCLELASIFCHVIDFNKTGYLPEKVKGKNLTSLLPESYPDFMGKQDHKSHYQSDKVLGKLYRISRRVEQAVTTIDKEDSVRIRTGTNWALDKRLLVPGYEQFIEQAQRLYDMYAEPLDSEQRRYGIESEEELVSGCVIKIKGMYSRSDEVFDIEKRLRERMKEVRKMTVKKFKEVLEESNIEGIPESRQEMMLAGACYYITYRDKRSHRSFPWVFSDTLLKILQRSQQPGPASPMEQLSKSIDNVEMREVEGTFTRHNIEQPPDDGLARVYHVLINWGHKSKFLGDSSWTDRLTVPHFADIIDQVVERNEEMQIALDQPSIDAGSVLCAVFRGITLLDDDLRAGSVSLSRAAVVNMKRQILLGHHQLARDPRAECLMTRLQTSITRTIAVTRERWDRIKQKTGDLRKQYKDQFNVHLDFRRQRNGGSICIKGLDQDVDDFTEFWTEKAPAQEGARPSPSIAESNLLRMLHDYNI